MSNEKFTQGEWYIKSGSPINGVESLSVYTMHGLLTSANVIKVDETRQDGESWIAMQSRTEIDREIAAIESNANIILISAAPDMYRALQMCKTILLDRGYGLCSTAQKIINDALAKADGVE